MAHNNRDYSQEERELIIEAIEQLLKEKEK